MIDDQEAGRSSTSLVDKTENCFPMIPSGAAHYDMLLGPDDRAARPVSEEGMVLV